ncbi:BLUF domain-containing protein [Stenotrophomonas maltophilia]|nr:BLUF domain-containing protein [Stenotrophomonas maltophilia]
MPKCAMVFLSAAVEDIGEERLAEVIVGGRQFNANCGSHGIVCFDGSRFLIYLEGAASAVAASCVYTESVTFHAEIVELARGSIQQLRFPAHALLFLPVSEAEMKGLMRSDWVNFSQRFGGRFVPETGMERLAELVNSRMNDIPR